MKKWIPMLLVLCLLLVPMAGNVSADDHEPLPPAGAEAVPVDPAAGMAQELAQAEALTQVPVFQPGTVPADAAPMDAISLPIHALVLSMLERGLIYEAQSDVFVWNALYYTLSMYGQVDDRAEQTEDALILPSEVVQDYLSALFASHSGLPQLPAELADRVSYDPLSDQYLLALGDFGLTDVRIDTTQYAAGGICLLEGALITPEDGSPLCGFRGTLVENESMFGFSVLELTIV